MASFLPNDFFALFSKLSSSKQSETRFSYNSSCFSVPHVLLCIWSSVSLMLALAYKQKVLFFFLKITFVWIILKISQRILVFVSKPKLQENTRKSKMYYTRGLFTLAARELLSSGNGKITGKWPSHVNGSRSCEFPPLESAQINGDLVRTFAIGTQPMEWVISVLPSPSCKHCEKVSTM